MTPTEPLLKDRIIILLQKNADWTMIKEIISGLKLDMDRMHLSGYLDALVDAGILEFKQVSSAKQYRLSLYRQEVPVESIPPR
ncbi:MAG: hypothetical protein JRN45_00710 [Nitrososphaerota archaeon]|nr:hypothetical protein [Nitrososphaerota archaeon]